MRNAADTFTARCRLGGGVRVSHPCVSLLSEGASLSLLSVVRLCLNDTVLTNELSHFLELLESPHF